MHRRMLIAICAVVIVLAGAGIWSIGRHRRSVRLRAITHPAVVTMAAAGRVASFAGEVGQLDADNGFADFVRSHARGIIDLDITIPEDEFAGGEDTGTSFFVVFDECEDLPENKIPAEPYCTGTEFNIPNATPGKSAFTRDDGTVYLRGRFRVQDAGGPFQGLTSVKLVPTV